MLKAINRMKVRDERGFTLVELLIVIAIIAILAAIAIPQFAQYRARGIEASMVSDAKNGATTMESIFADCQNYTATVAFAAQVATFTGSAGLCATAGNSVQTSRVSIGNTLALSPAATATTYDVCVTNANARSGRRAVTIDETGNQTWADACS